MMASLDGAALRATHRNGYKRAAKHLEKRVVRFVDCRALVDAYTFVDENVVVAQRALVDEHLREKSRVSRWAARQSIVVNRDVA